MSRGGYIITYISLFFVVFAFLRCASDNRHDQSPEERFSFIPAKDSKIDFINKLTERVDLNIITTEYFFNGGGVAVGDINNDGLPDIYFVANQLSNALYLNRGNFKFENITKKSGAGGHKGWATGANMIDINNDGYLDIYVNYGGALKSTSRGNELYINNGNLTFSERSKEYGLNDHSKSTQSAFFDYDKDGDLDMFLLNHETKNPKIKDLEKFLAKRSQTAGDKLYRNDNGFFNDVSVEAGIIGNALGFGLGVSVGDVNNDGWPDIFVANDFSENDYLYLNNKNGSFTESSDAAFKHISNFSMGSDIADINNDGWLDILSLDMVAEDNYSQKTSMSAMDEKKFRYIVDHGFHYQYMSNALHLNMGNGKFSEIAQLANVSNTDWSWGALFGDFDNDGYKDLFVTNGFRRNFRDNDFQKYMKGKFETSSHDRESIPYLMKELIEKMPVKQIPNCMFRNNAALGFDNVTLGWGFSEPSFSNACAYADFDNDGDLDLVVNNVDQPPFIYKNNLRPQDHNYLKIRLNGSKRNLNGIGSKVEIRYDGKKQIAEHYVTRGFQSSMTHEIHFGLGDHTVIDSVIVTWFDGKKQIERNVRSGQQIKLEYADAAYAGYAQDWNPLLFTPTSNNLSLNFRHRENEYDDYAVQVLLPHKYSQFGPGISVADINADGLDDFFIGGAHGQPGALHVQQVNGNFEITEGPWNKQEQLEDLSNVFFDADNDGDQDLYIVSGGNEFLDGDPLLADRLYRNNGNGNFEDISNLLPRNYFSGSKVRPSDFDKDGFTDLFVGGRHMPHQYPIPASGYLYKNVNGTFKDVTDKIAPGLKSLGLITDALWVDIDKDEDQDLLIVGEWMPITVFRNERGHFTKSLLDDSGLENTEGWWYSIDAADFDNDGDLDLIAGNLGLNYKYEASTKEPFEVYASDFNNNDKIDVILAFHEKNNIYPLRGRECSSQQIPSIKEKFASYQAFGIATVEDMVGSREIKNALHLNAKTFATTYFENKGNGRFQSKPLPALAQLSSVNDMVIDDFNKDGNLDVVLAGNLLVSEVETPRNDASYGVFLSGDGKGNFKQYYPYESGLYLDGDVKELAVIKSKTSKYLIAAKNNEKIQLIKVDNE